MPSIPSPKTMTTTEIKKLVLQILALTIFVFFAFGFYYIFMSKFVEKRNLSITLRRYAENMNNECPIAIGDGNDLIIEKVSFIKERTIIYEYRILKYTKDDYDLQKLKENVLSTSIDEVESIESLAILRNKDVIFEYVYFDKQREEMFRIKILFNTPITEIN